MSEVLEEADELSALITGLRDGSNRGRARVLEILSSTDHEPTLDDVTNLCFNAIRRVEIAEGLVREMEDLEVEGLEEGDRKDFDAHKAFAKRELEKIRNDLKKIEDKLKDKFRNQTYVVPKDDPIVKQLKELTATLKTKAEAISYRFNQNDKLNLKNLELFMDAQKQMNAWRAEAEDICVADSQYKEFLDTLDTELNSLENVFKQYQPILEKYLKSITEDFPRDVKPEGKPAFIQERQIVINQARNLLSLIADDDERVRVKKMIRNAQTNLSELQSKTPRTAGEWEFFEKIDRINALVDSLQTISEDNIEGEVRKYEQIRQALKEIEDPNVENSKKVLSDLKNKFYEKEQQLLNEEGALNILSAFINERTVAVLSVSSRAEKYPFTNAQANIKAIDDSLELMKDVEVADEEDNLEDNLEVDEQIEAALKKQSEAKKVLMQMEMQHYTNEADKLKSSIINQANVTSDFISDLDARLDEVDTACKRLEKEYNQLVEKDASIDRIFATFIDHVNQADWAFVQMQMQDYANRGKELQKQIIAAVDTLSFNTITAATTLPPKKVKGTTPPELGKVVNLTDKPKQDPLARIKSLHEEYIVLSAEAAEFDTLNLEFKKQFPKDQNNNGRTQYENNLTFLKNHKPLDDALKEAEKKKNKFLAGEVINRSNVVVKNLDNIKKSFHNVMEIFKGDKEISKDDYDQAFASFNLALSKLSNVDKHIRQAKEANAKLGSEDEEASKSLREMNDAYNTTMEMLRSEVNEGLHVYITNNKKAVEAIDPTEQAQIDAAENRLWGMNAAFTVMESIDYVMKIEPGQLDPAGKQLLEADEHLDNVKEAEQVTTLTQAGMKYLEAATEEIDALLDGTVDDATPSISAISAKLTEVGKILAQVKLSMGDNPIATKAVRELEEEYADTIEMYKNDNFIKILSDYITHYKDKIVNEVRDPNNTQQIDAVTKQLEGMQAAYEILKLIAPDSKQLTKAEKELDQARENIEQEELAESVISAAYEGLAELEKVKTATANINKIFATEAEQSEDELINNAKPNFLQLAKGLVAAGAKLAQTKEAAAELEDNEVANLAVTTLDDTLKKSALNLLVSEDDDDEPIHEPIDFFAAYIEHLKDQVVAVTVKDISADTVREQMEQLQTAYNAMKLVVECLPESDSYKNYTTKAQTALKEASDHVEKLKLQQEAAEVTTLTKEGLEALQKVGEIANGFDELFTEIDKLTKQQTAANAADDDNENVSVRTPSAIEKALDSNIAKATTLIQKLAKGLELAATNFNNARQLPQNTIAAEAVKELNGKLSEVAQKLFDDSENGDSTIVNLANYIEQVKEKVISMTNIEELDISEVQKQIEAMESAYKAMKVIGDFSVSPQGEEVVQEDEDIFKSAPKHLGEARAHLAQLELKLREKNEAQKVIDGANKAFKEIEGIKEIVTEITPLLADKNNVLTNEQYENATRLIMDLYNKFDLVTVSIDAVKKLAGEMQNNKIAAATVADLNSHFDAFKEEIFRAEFNDSLSHYISDTTKYLEGRKDTPTAEDVSLVSDNCIEGLKAADDIMNLVDERSENESEQLKDAADNLEKAEKYALEIQVNFKVKQLEVLNKKINDEMGKIDPTRASAREMVNKLKPEVKSAKEIKAEIDKLLKKPGQPAAVKTLEENHRKKFESHDNMVTAFDKLDSEANKPKFANIISETGQYNQFRDQVILKTDARDPGKLPVGKKSDATKDDLNPQSSATFAKSGSLRFQGKLVRPLEVLQSTRTFEPQKITEGGRERIIERRAMLLQDHQGRVSDYSTDNLTKVDKQITAVRQAQMMLQNWQPDRGDIIISQAKDKETANMLFAALLSIKKEGQKLNSKLGYVKIQSWIPDTGPKKSWGGLSSGEDAFIKQYLPDVTNIVKNTAKMVADATKLVDERHKMLKRDPTKKDEHALKHDELIDIVKNMKKEVTKGRAANKQEDNENDSTPPLGPT
jgi:hypothetical protein